MGRWRRCPCGSSTSRMSRHAYQPLLCCTVCRILLHYSALCIALIMSATASSLTQSTSRPRECWCGERQRTLPRRCAYRSAPLRCAAFGHAVVHTVCRALPCLALPGEGNAPIADVRVVRHGARRGTPTPAGSDCCGCNAEAPPTASAHWPTWRKRGQSHCPLNAQAAATAAIDAMQPDRLTNAHSPVQRRQ